MFDLRPFERRTHQPEAATDPSVPIKRRAVLARLRSLEDDGELASKTVGGRNTVWWIPDDHSE